MRHFFTRRASGKRRNSQGKDKAENITASPNNSDPTADGDVVVAAVGGGEGEVRRSGGQRRSSSSSSSSNPVPPSPVPDFRAGEEPVSLKDFASQRKVPGFAKVVKGSYMTIGGSRFSFQKQHHDVFIHSVQAGVKVLAHGVKRVESHRRGGETSVRLCPMDQRLTVPMTYQGWFELLSEDGKSARPIRSVPELARASPTRCLVRENVKGYLNTGEGRLTFDKTKAVLAGEQLRLCEVLSLPAPGQGLKVKLLRCVDAKGDEVYLSFDQKGLFTPIAEDDDLVGVFTIRDIIRRFRLPLTVQLVHGVRPKVPDSKFSGLVRLDWVYSEETAFVSPLEKNHVRLLPVPCDVSLQLVAASNQEDMAKSDMFRSLQAKCARMVSNYNNTIHLIVSVPDSVLKRKKTQTRTSGGSNIFSPEQPDTHGSDRRPARRSKSREDLLMDEIDDLYSYVRDGGTPPAKTRFQYNSDEESYWEEPAYEALGEFRARVEAMERGQEVCFPDRYPPADPTRLRGLVGEGGGGGGGGGGPVRPSSSASGAAAERAEQGVEKCVHPSYHQWELLNVLRSVVQVMQLKNNQNKLVYHQRVQMQMQSTMWRNVQVVQLMNNLNKL
ncbi:uncharacterized protein LOC143295166 [Babylonia areolata]|uniref:uncharacterized protein LOC143295166 n=1 Tax=Babylonia areolata TaxID=304850 RepID=UPI003FD2FB8C